MTRTSWPDGGAAEIFRGPETPGSLERHKPAKEEASDWGTAVEGAVNALEDGADAAAASLATVQGEVAALQVGQLAGRILAATWSGTSGLSTIVGTVDHSGGEVTGPDSGTHADPVTAATVANEGVYAWIPGSAAWTRIGDRYDTVTLSSDVNAGRAAVKATLNSSPSTSFKIDSATGDLIDARRKAARVVLIKPQLINGVLHAVKEIDYGGKIKKAENLVTQADYYAPGIPSPGSASVALPFRYYLTVTGATGALDIYKPGPNDTAKWVHHAIGHLSAPVGSYPSNYDIWHTTNIEGMTGAPGGFVSDNRIYRSGELEKAIICADAANFVGGSSHGNEIQYFVRLLIDGREHDLSVDFAGYAQDVQLFQRSFIYKYGTTTNLAGDQLLDMATRWRWANDRAFYLTNYGVWKAAKSVKNAYMSMMSFQDDIFATAQRSPLFATESLPGVSGSSGYIQGYPGKATWIVAGDGGYAMEVSVVDGWRSLGYSNIEWKDTEGDGSQRLKIYNSLFGGGTANPESVTVGQTFESTTRYQIEFTG